MPDMENGPITAVTSSVIGLVTSAVVSAVLPASPAALRVSAEI